MLDADFWRDLANQFRDLPRFDALRVEWVVIAGTRAWTAIGNSPSTVTRFTSLAKRCGLKLVPSQPNPFGTWMNAVYGEHPSLANPTGWSQAPRETPRIAVKF